MAITYEADGGSTGVKKTVTPTPAPTPTTTTPAQIPKQPSATQLAGYSPVNPPTTTEPVKTPHQGVPMPAPTTKTATTGATTGAVTGATAGVKTTTPVKDPILDVQKKPPATTVTPEVKLDSTVKAPDTSKGVSDIKDAAAKIYDEKWEAEQQAYMGKLLELMERDNVYMAKLSEMEFNYDPYADQDYIRQAAGLENQVAQMMVGRGGLYSSVASSAVQSGLMNLQVDMRAQKYNEYVDNRNFTMSMAQMEMQQRNDYFNQLMTIKQDQDRQRSDAFNRFVTITEMEMKAQQQAYENAFREMEYKQQQIDNANRMSMERERLEMQRAEQAYNIEQREASFKLEKDIGKLQSDFAFWSDYAGNFDRINKMWSSGAGTANNEVVQFYNALGFNINLGAKLSMYPNMQMAAARALDNFEKSLKDQAFQLQQGQAIMEMINSVKYPKIATDKMTIEETSGMLGTGTKTTIVTEVPRTGTTPTSSSGTLSNSIQTQ